MRRKLKFKRLKEVRPARIGNFKGMEKPAGTVKSAKEIGTVILLILAICLLFGTGLQLQPGCLLIGTALCLVQAPGLYHSYKRSDYERKRFRDVNAYLAHMVQAFADSGKILTALRTAREVFPKGSLRQLLTRAICMIEQAEDVELAEEEAFALIREEYDCERVRTLHDFLRKAESRGGSCNREFRLLECTRQSWEKFAVKYRQTLCMARNMVAFEYALLILICIFMLRQFPEELEILTLPLVQGLNMLLVVCFFLVYGRLERKLGESMLTEREFMPEQRAQRYFGRVRRFREKKTLFRYLSGMPALRSLRAEVKRAFPGWLFDVLLLMQSENVAVSMLQSIEKAPPVLREELKRMKQVLEEDPASQEAYLSFLAELQIPQVENAMRYLYAVSTGMRGETEAMELLMELNLNMQAEAERQKLKRKGDMFSAYYLLPTVPVMVCMMGYAAALIFVIFQKIMTII